MKTFPSVELLESRIAPAQALLSVLPDVVAGMGKTGVQIDLNDPSRFHTKVLLTTNFDIDPVTPGLQPGVIVFEMLNEQAPDSVANFIKYVTSKDYDGTFFHRSVSGFVVQGGGFNANALSTHIPVFGDVHNEYDPSRSNLVGTVAMAKTGAGPNTATSEFFVNLGDNSSNLDNQNGGFTVFAKVTQGMDVMNKIAALTHQNFSNLQGANGALTEVPVQSSYNANPDNDASTPAPLPKAADLITITKTQVLAPSAAAPGASGVTYGFEVVSGPAGLITGKLSGSTLALKYGAGKTGTATVRVTATHGTDAPETEEFTVTVQPNLASTITKDGLAQILVPGGSGSISVKLSNTAASTLSGTAKVSFYLSKVTTDDPTGMLVDAGDRLLTVVDGVKLNLASGKSTTVTGKVISLPLDLSATDVQGEQFRVIAVTEVSGTTSVDRFSDDNNALNGNVHYFATKPNLVAQTVGETIPSVAVPGDKGIYSLRLGNAGAGLLNGTVDVTFYLSRIDGNGGTDPYGTLIEAGVDQVVGSIHGVTLGLNSGATKLISGAYTIPAELFKNQGQGYRILAEVKPVGTVSEYRDDDDNATNSMEHLIFNAFGTFNGRKNVPMTYKDANNNTVTLTLSGGGYGQVQGYDDTLDSQNQVTKVGTLNDLNVELYGTNPASALSAKVSGTVAGVHTPIHDLYTVQSPTATVARVPMGTVALAAVDIHGAVEFQGGLKTLTLGNLHDPAGNHYVYVGPLLGAPTLGAVLKFGAVTDYSLLSTMPVASLSADNWLNSDANAESIVAYGLKSMSIVGDLQTRVAANFDNNGVAYSKTKLATFNVGGTLSGVLVQVGGAVGKASVGGMTQSQFYAGVTALPNGISTFAFDARNFGIDSFSLKGSNNGLASGVFKDSQVAAASLGAVFVQNVDGTTASVDTFGFTAYKIHTYVSNTDHESNLVFRTPNLPHDLQGSYRVQII